MTHIDSRDPAGLAEKLQDPRAAQIPCPWWRVVINENLIQVDPDGTVSIQQLRQALKHSGMSLALREFMLVGVRPAAAQMAGLLNGVFGFLYAISMDRINVLELPRCYFMHRADSGILRHGFDQEKLDQLLSYSSDGLNLTVSDMAAANKHQLEREPGVYGHLVGLVEYSLLLSVFGHNNAAGERSISNQDVTTVYRENRFPANWHRQAIGFIRFNGAVANIISHQRRDPPRRPKGCPKIERE